MNYLYLILIIGALCAMFNMLNSGNEPPREMRAPPIEPPIEPTSVEPVKPKRKPRAKPKAKVIKKKK